MESSIVLTLGCGKTSSRLVRDVLVDMTSKGFVCADAIDGHHGLGVPHTSSTLYIATGTFDQDNFVLLCQTSMSPQGIEA